MKLNKEQLEFVKVLWSESNYSGLHETFDEFRETSEFWIGFELLLENLFKHVKKSKEFAVARCNGPWHDECEKADDHNDERIAKIGKAFGVSFSLSGDPRGYVVKLMTPKTKMYNTWGGAECGWGVPGS